MVLRYKINLAWISITVIENLLYIFADIKSFYNYLPEVTFQLCHTFTCMAVTVLWCIRILILSWFRRVTWWTQTNSPILIEFQQALIAWIWYPLKYHMTISNFLNQIHNFKLFIYLLFAFCQQLSPFWEPMTFKSFTARY